MVFILFNNIHYIFHFLHVIFSKNKTNFNLFLITSLNESVTLRHNAKCMKLLYSWSVLRDCEIYNDTGWCIRNRMSENADIQNFWIVDSCIRKNKFSDDGFLYPKILI